MDLAQLVRAYENEDDVGNSGALLGLAGTEVYHWQASRGAHRESWRR